MNDEWRCDIPKLVPMEQSIDEPVVEDPWSKAFQDVSAQLDKTGSIGPGSRVAITVGSRGIGGIADVVRGIVDALKHHGAEPFIVPAMGSHGGTDPREKASILSHLGVTEASVGARISSTAEIVLAGEGPDGIPVYCQKEALSADAIILLNRVKPHTDFHGDLESGLVKIACVGLGGYLGAQWIHLLGYDHLAERIKAAGGSAIRMLNIPFGVAIIEGHSGRPAIMKVIPGDAIISEEQELLDVARRTLLRLPVKKNDILVVGKMGKEISGLGLDSQITGRYPSGKAMPGEDVPDIQRVVILDLSDASGGNASGVGLCDITTRRLFNKIDFRNMYKNVITSRGSASAKIPMVMESDREAISVGLLTCHLKEGSNPELILIRDTLHLQRFLVSPSLVPRCEQQGARKIGEPMDLQFDDMGSLVWPACLDISH